MPPQIPPPTIDFDRFDDLTPNERDDDKTRLRKALQWLDENPKEKIATAARIFKVGRSRISHTLHRKGKGSHRGQNKILTAKQEKQVHLFVRD